MMRIRERLVAAAVVSGLVGLGLVSGSFLTQKVLTFTQMAVVQDAQAETATPTNSTADRYRNLELFQKVLHFVENNYVDETKNKDLVYGAIKGMLETLDPHSNFLPPDVFKDMKIDTSGKFGGLGIEIGMKDSVLTVMTPIEDTPAWRAGLKPNDRIVKIDGESTKGLSLTEAVQKMRGKKGTPVKLTIYRQGFDRFKDVSIVRDIIKIRSVKSEELDSGYGYVRLSTFNEDASHDMKEAIDKLSKKGKLKGLIFDMRYTPGGLLDQAIEVTSLFIEEGVVVSTIGRDKSQKEVKYARKGMAYKDLPVAILVNSSTASAAEIVAGALQDHHRAIVMGQPTFGKGSVQTVIELGDAGLKLTIARYYTPSGRSIQEKGVQPDILLEDYDPKLLAKAKIVTESTREKDLKGHIVDPGKSEENAESSKQAKDDFNMHELESSSKKGKDGKDDKGNEVDEDFVPVRMDPKKDYQVHQAVNYLKSFDVFQKIQGSPRAAPKSAAGN